MYHNCVGLETELCTRRLATAGNLLCAAPVCSHTALQPLPHSTGIKEGEENTPGYTSGTASEGVWQSMAEVQRCDKHPIAVSVKWCDTLICLRDVVFAFCCSIESWFVCVVKARAHTRLRDDDTTALAWRSVITKTWGWDKACTNRWNARQKRVLRRVPGLQVKLQDGEKKKHLKFQHRGNFTHYLSSCTPHILTTETGEKVKTGLIFQFKTWEGNLVYNRAVQMCPSVVCSILAKFRTNKSHNSKSLRWCVVK